MIPSRFQIFATLRRCLIAVWTVGAAFALTLIASPFIDPGVSPLFLLAVLVSAWRGGLAAGLVATFLSAFASAFVFLPPRFSLDIGRSDMFQLIVFTIAAVIIGSLSAGRRRAEEAREKLLRTEKTARLEAEQANRVKDEFLAAVSHELRTPLTTIKTLTRVMQRRETTESERAEFLADIASECDREIDLILNLLDLSRIKAGGISLSPQRIDPAEMLAACQKLVRGEAETHGHEVTIELAPDINSIRADPGALRRALCAIAENAIKFTGENGRIQLRAEKHGEREVLLIVEDNGRGIDPADLPYVFDKFYRGAHAGSGSRPSTSEVPGIGLGLNLAATLIEGMNGKIEVVSRPGEGSRFIISLPAWSEVDM